MLPCEAQWLCLMLERERREVRGDRASKQVGTCLHALLAPFPVEVKGGIVALPVCDITALGDDFYPDTFSHPEKRDSLLVFLGNSLHTSG